MMSMTVLLCTSKILQFGHCAWKFCSFKFLPGRTGQKGERTMSTLNTEVVPLLSTSIQMVSCESIGNLVQPTILAASVDERQFPENQQAPMAFLGATTNIIRDQSRAFDRAGLTMIRGVENIDVVKLTKKLETLETSRLLDISGDVTGF